ncbi:MAG: hypothetical protein GX048_01285 [Bacteroidales bacterium]|nr:hypothetical protein [Bacteroidales bacterium]
MYQKVSILFFVLTLLSCHIYSQATIAQGKTYPLSNDLNLIFFQSLSDNNSILFSKTSDTYKLELIDTKKSSIAKSLILPTKIKAGSYSYQVNYANSFIINDSLYVFYKLFDRGKKGNALWYNVYDCKTLTMVQDYNEVAFYEFDPRQKMLAGEFEVYINPEKSYFLVSQPIPRYPYEREKFKYFALDKNFNKIWEKEIDFKFIDKDYSIKQITIDNRANAFILLFNNTDKSYLLFAITNNGENLKNINISSIIDPNCLAPKLYSVAQNTFLISFVGNIENENIDKLSFYIFDNQLDTFKKFTHIPLTKDFLNVEIDKNKKESLNERTKSIDELAFNIDTIILLNNNYWIIGEKRFIYQEGFTLNDPQTGTQRTNVVDNYNAHSIYIIQLDDNGQMIWSKKIHKNQYTNNKNLALLLGYSFNIIDNELHFIFNDNISNNNESDITLPATFAGEQACISLAIVDKIGNINRTSILTYKDLNGAIMPHLSLIQSNDNLFLAVAALRKSVNQFTNIKEFYFANYKIQ